MEQLVWWLTPRKSINLKSTEESGSKYGLHRFIEEVRCLQMKVYKGKYSCKHYNVTPSSHIYLSNRPTEVNMWREVIMMWFDLLSHVKEVEQIETHHTNLQHQQ